MMEINNEVFVELREEFFDNIKNFTVASVRESDSLVLYTSLCFQKTPDIVKSVLSGEKGNKLIKNVFEFDVNSKLDRPTEDVFIYFREMFKEILRSVEKYLFTALTLEDYLWETRCRFMRTALPGLEIRIEQFRWIEEANPKEIALFLLFLNLCFDENDWTESIDKEPVNTKFTSIKSNYEDVKYFYMIIEEALRDPGIMNSAYKAFHSFSGNNIRLLTAQILERQMKIGPVNTKNNWAKFGRFVMAGEEALGVYRPSAKAVNFIKINDEKLDSVEIKSATRFFFNKCEYTYYQTEGDEYKQENSTPEWSPKLVQEKNKIKEVGFESINGNVQGYAIGYTIAINPLASLKHKTRIHEICHILLGHQGSMKRKNIPKKIKEVEAELATYLVISSLDMDGKSESRAYIQNWLKKDVLPEDSATIVVKTAMKILKDGQLSFDKDKSMTS